MKELFMQPFNNQPAESFFALNYAKEFAKKLVPILLHSDRYTVKLSEIRLDDLAPKDSSYNYIYNYMKEAFEVAKHYDKYQNFNVLLVKLENSTHWSHCLEFANIVGHPLDWVEFFIFYAYLIQEHKENYAYNIKFSLMYWKEGNTKKPKTLSFRKVVSYVDDFECLYSFCVAF